MIVYLFGEPGVGKSTLTKKLLDHFTEGEPTFHPQPFAHATWPNGITTLGNPTPKNPKHPGTDTLPYNAMPKAIAWVQEQPNTQLIIGEGDRLASPKFWDAAHAAGHTILPIYLHNPHHAQLQRQARGTQQNPTWIAGRQTRAINLSHYPGTLICNPHNPRTLQDITTVIQGERP
jgi:GTPase SAR1 family protein